MNSIQDDLLSVMIRCDTHDLAALDRGLFHLFSQQYRPIEVVVVISASLEIDFLAGVKDLHSRWASSFVHFEMLQELKGDLLNLEHVIQRCHGRYLTIFNVMNKVYPHFYQSAISNLQNHLQYGWANCDVVMTHYSSDGNIEKRWTPFLRTKYSFLDHLKFDFVPIDSVIIDRLRIPEIDQFQDYFFSHDDHTILLKIACLYQPIYLSFIGIEISVGHEQETNNVDFAEEVVKRFSKFDQKKLPGLWWGNQIFNTAWEAEFNDASFRTSLLRYDRQLHPQSYRYRNMLEECYKSPSWRLTKYFRHLINYFKGLPSPDDKTPETEELAITQLLLLYQSSSWLITWPIRKMLNKSMSR